MHTHTHTNHWQRSVNEWCGALKAIPYRAHNNEDLTELLYTGRLYNTIIWLLINSVIGAFLILLFIFHICCIPLTKHRCKCYMPKLCMVFFVLCCFSFVYLFIEIANYSGHHLHLFIRRCVAMSQTGYIYNINNLSW